MDEKPKEDKPIELGVGGDIVSAPTPEVSKEAGASPTVDPSPDQKPDSEQSPPSAVATEPQPQAPTTPGSDLPPVVLRPPSQGGQKKKVVIGVLMLVLLLGGLTAGLIAVRQRQIVTKKAEGGGPITASNCQVAAGQSSCPTTVSWSFTAALDTNFLIKVTTSDLDGQNAVVSDWKGFWHGPKCTGPYPNVCPCDCNPSGLPSSQCNYPNCTPDQNGSDSYTLICSKKYIFRLRDLDAQRDYGDTGYVQANGCNAPTTPPATPAVPDCLHLTTAADLNNLQVGTAYAFQLTAGGNAPITNVEMSVYDGTNCSNNLKPYAPKSVSGPGTYAINWTPTTSGPFVAYGRVWNDGIAECRAACVDGPPRFLCAGAAVCKLSGTVKGPTPTPTGTATAAPTPTATATIAPTPTPTTAPSCNAFCNSDSDCRDGLRCVTNKCRNNLCQDQSSCSCPTPAPTGTPGPTATPIPTVNPTPGPTTPPAGFSLPTWGTYVASAFALVGGLLLLAL